MFHYYRSLASAGLVMALTVIAVLLLIVYLVNSHPGTRTCICSVLYPMNLAPYLVFSISFGSCFLPGTVLGLGCIRDYYR